MIKRVILECKTKTPQGKLTTNGVVSEKHEMTSMNFLLAFGLDIELSLPSLTPGAKSPDIFMLNLQWEIKSPITDKPNRIAVVFHHALKQSPNLIFDLRRISQETQPTEKYLENLFATSKHAKNLIIITKNQKQAILYKKR